MNNWSMPLWDQDEAAYAGFAKNMIDRSDYLVPEYFLSDAHRKPPLHFWSIVLSYRIFGVNEFAVRVPSVLSILGTLLLVLFQAKKLIGERAAFNSTVVLGTSILVSSLGKISVTDATLLFFSTLSGFSLLNTLKSPSFKWGFFFYLGLALGMLTKGPPILIFIGLFAVLLFIFHPERKNLLKLRPWFFLPLSFVPFILWAYLTTLSDDGEMLRWMYDWYIAKRVSGAVFGQTGPVGTHIVLIFAFFILYLMYSFTGFKNGVLGMIKKDPIFISILSWFISGWFIYEFSPSKLPAYTISSHVAFALIIGYQIEQIRKQGTIPNKWIIIIHYLILFLVSIALITANLFLPINRSLGIGLFAIGIIFAALNILQLFKLRSTDFINIQLSTNVIFFIGMWSIAPLFSEHINSSQKVSEVVLKQAQIDAPIIIGYTPGNQPSLPFYLSQLDNPIIIENDPGRFFGLYDSITTGTFIMNEEKYQFLADKFPNFDTIMVLSRLIDRTEQARYIIHFKK